ncbi:MAG: AAA family ATPase [Gemmatimonadetes bacterium]|nr:AAA family ATPase [Gemmatimonadota bacterium]
MSNPRPNISAERTDRRKLTIGIQTFREIRADNYYYVDKTAYIRRMLDEGKHYFLSRPRRFGKSLFLDTLKELFEGNEALSEGLHIHDRWDWSVRHPVVRLSFGKGYYASVFYSYFESVGLDIVVEDSSSHGRLDMAVLFNGNVYLFEFKVVELVPEGAAMEQLKERRYADKYRARGEPIHLIAVEFSRESRNVVAFEVESVPEHREES